MIWLVLYFLQFYISSLRGKKNILPNYTNSREPEPHVLKPAPLEKKYHEPELEPLGKKSGARAAKKLPGSSALVICQYTYTYIQIKSFKIDI